MITITIKIAIAITIAYNYFYYYISFKFIGNNFIAFIVSRRIHFIIMIMNKIIIKIIIIITFEKQVVKVINSSRLCDNMFNLKYDEISMLYYSL